MDIKELGIVKMVRGLAKKPDTREYKEARIALERLSAPLLALLLPSLAVAVLMVVTAFGGRRGPTEWLVDIAAADPDDAVLEPLETPPELADPVEPAVVDIPVAVVDGPAPTADELAPPEIRPTAAEAPKLREMSAIDVQSPVSFKGWRTLDYASRSAAARARALGDGAGGSLGSEATEQAVLKALRWLRKTQRPDGAWAGTSPAAMAGFAVLTFLAHGETPASREFGPTVRKALDHLVDGMHEEKGVARMRGSDGNEYAFPIATYALCEAYGMTRNPNVKAAAEKGLERIVANQSPTGGWDYGLNRASVRDDLSFGGWALQAVKAGRMAGIEVPGLDTCIAKSIRYLQKRAFRKGGFGYCAGNNPGGLTGTGCLALQLLGAGKSKEVRAALDFMRGWRPVWEDHPGGKNAQYYSYYAAQCKYQAGMRPGATPADVTEWRKWNAAMKAAYPAALIVDKETVTDPAGRPCATAHWENRDAYHDPVMATCLCALQLMVYYRYLPTTTLHAADPEPDVAALAKDVRGEVGVAVDL